MKQKRMISQTVTLRAYGIPELIQLYPVSEGFLRGEIRRGALAATRLGRRRTLILKEDWDAYLKQSQNS